VTQSSFFANRPDIPANLRNYMAVKSAPEPDYSAKRVTIATTVRCGMAMSYRYKLLSWNVPDE